MFRQAVLLAFEPAYALEWFCDIIHGAGAFGSFPKADLRNHRALLTVRFPENITQNAIAAGFAACASMAPSSTCSPDSTIA
jgi:hypothetical protein